MKRAEGTVAQGLALPALGRAESCLAWRSLALAVGGGIASAIFGQLLGKPMQAIWAVPTAGSVAAALPRTIILLLMMQKVNRWGSLTTAGLAEVGTGLVIGAGAFWPTAVVAPVLACITGDIAWSFVCRLPGRMLGLMATGCVLCVARVLVALCFWVWLRPLALAWSDWVPVLAGIVLINAILGLLGGLIVARVTKVWKQV